MDILLGIGGALLALVVLAVALGLLGAVGYLLYIPIRSGWAIMRLVLENFGFFERDSPAESIEKSVSRIHEEITEINKKLDERR
jgi:hypothetical protein